MVDRVVTPPVIVDKAMLENSAKNQCAKNLVKMEVHWNVGAMDIKVSLEMAQLAIVQLQLQ